MDGLRNVTPDKFTELVLRILSEAIILRGHRRYDEVQLVLIPLREMGQVEFEGENRVSFVSGAVRIDHVLV